jgi:hypothetical protein
MRDLHKRDWVLIGIAVILAVVAATIMFPDSVGYVVDSIGDAFVTLTTSEESRLAQLEPETQDKVRELLGRMQAQGVTIHVGQTFRTSAEEKAAIEEGRSAVKSNSWHESGRAADLYPIDPDTLQPDTAGKRVDLFRQMQQEAVSMGFHQLAFDTTTWEKRFLTTSKGKIWDGGHVEWHGGYASATDALNAYLNEDIG